MQASGQYGLPEVPQYVVGRGPPSHMFNLSHEMSLSPSSGHGHTHSHSPHSHPQHHHQQQQQPQQLQHHHLQQQQHQHLQQPQQPQQDSKPQQVQQPHVQSQQLQQQQPQQQPQQLGQNNQQQQQQMVQQLGVGSDSLEDASPIACRPPPNSHSKALAVVRDQSLGVEDHEGLTDEGEKGSAGNRWPRQETIALLKIRSDMDTTFRDSSLKGPLWEEVSRKLADIGYHRSAKKCKEKFENVHKYYKRTKDGKAGRQDGKSYRFFNQLEALYGNVSGPRSTSNVNVGKIDSGIGLGTAPSNTQGERGGFLFTRGSVGTSGANDATGRLDYSSGFNFSSDSSDDNYEDPGDNENLESKKRKRKSSKKFLMFFENLMKKVIEKQEQMQQRFLEALERREHDRMIREEAWKRQEMSRMNREHELRAQERALAANRDAALVAFLQRVTGQTLELPPIALPAQPISSAPDVHEEHHQDKESLNPNSKRWPKPEVLALIRLRTGMQTRFHDPGPKGTLWEEISAELSSLGYTRNAKRCKEKWENINKYFKKAKDSNKKRPENAKTCPYYHQLDALYRKGLLGGSQNKLLGNKVEDRPEEMLEQPSGSNREDSGQAQVGDSDILAIMPSGENAPAPAGASTSNGIATHFFSSAETGNGDDRGLKKVKLKQNLIDSSSGNPPASLGLNFDWMNDENDFSGNTESVSSEEQDKELEEDMY